MKYSKLAAMFITASLLSTTTLAYNIKDFKGEILTTSGPYNWSGFFVGVNAGAVGHTMNITDVGATTFNSTIQQQANPKFTGGFQLGYRRQLTPDKISAVFGGEFSADFSNATFNKEYGSPFSLYQLDSENALKTALLLQLIGGIAADRTLLFMAAGLSWTNITGSMTNVVSIPFFTTLNLGQKTVGSAIGAGMEYAFSNALSVRLKVDVITPNSFSTFDDSDNSYQISNSIVLGTLGLNYKFG